MSPPSKVPSQVFGNQLVTIPLEKFSFAVTTLGTGNHQWIHENRADKLFLVFRQTRQHGGQDTAEIPLLMNVTVGSQTLERQDLKKLKAMAEDFEIQCRNRLADHPLEPPVYVMVKFPCIALRYPTSLTLRRRIQMRFKNEADYRKVIDIFEGLKLPLNDIGRKDSSAAPIRALNPASASVVRNLAGPHASHQSSVSLGVIDYETPVSSTANESSYGLTTQNLTEESPFFRRSHTASSETIRPSSAWSLGGQKAADTASSRSLGEQLVRPSSVPEHGRSILFCEPEKRTRLALLRSSELEREHTSQSLVPQYKDENLAYTRKRTLSKTFGTSLSRAATTLSNGLLSGSTDEFGLARRAISGCENTIVEGFDNGEQINKRMSLVPEFLRPLSAPVPSTPEKLSQWVPPRRELPFPKTRASTKTLIPTTSLLGPSQPEFRVDKRQVIEDAECVSSGTSTQPLPGAMKRITRQQTSRVELATARNASEPLAEDSSDVDDRYARLQMLAESQEELSSHAARSVAVCRPSTAPGLQSAATNMATRKRGREEELNTESVSKQAKMMANKATQTQTCSGRDHTASLAVMAGARKSAFSAPDAASQPPESFMSEIETFVSKYKNRPLPEELWQRPGYSTASPEERQAIINDFICENLDNEDFLKLCEDMGNVWRRIGLELSE